MLAPPDHPGLPVYFMHVTAQMKALSPLLSFATSAGAETGLALCSAGWRYGEAATRGDSTSTWRLFVGN